MLYYEIIDLGIENDSAKSTNSTKCIALHYCCFSHGLKFQNSYCNSCPDLTMLCLNFSTISVIAVKSVDYRCIIHGIRKSETIHLLENSLLDNREYI